MMGESANNGVFLTIEGIEGAGKTTCLTQLRERIEAAGQLILGAALMNHRHRKVLHTLFAHPVNTNIAMKDVESVLRELGADVSEAHSGRLHVVLNGHSVNFSHAKHSLGKQQVMQVRKFIETCGIDPKRDYPI